MDMLAGVASPAIIFRNCPRDEFVGIGDVAGLAVDTVAEIDLHASAAVVGRHELIDSSGAESLAWIAILFATARDTDAGVRDDQVAGLVFFVYGAGVVDARHLVKSQLAIRPKG